MDNINHLYKVLSAAFTPLWDTFTLLVDHRHLIAVHWTIPFNALHNTYCI